MRIRHDLHDSAPFDLLGNEGRLGFKSSKTDTIVVALRELVRRHRIEDLKSMLGRVELDVHLNSSRRRSKRVRQ